MNRTDDTCMLMATTENMSRNVLSFVGFDGHHNYMNMHFDLKTVNKDLGQVSYLHFHLQIYQRKSTSNIDFAGVATSGDAALTLNMVLLVL